MQSNLKWVYSRDLQALAKSLANNLKGSRLDDLFKKEIIMVQSQGMKRYVSLLLAESSALGIALNIEYVFPKKFIDKIFCGLFPDIIKNKAEEKTAATFAIMQQLPQLISEMPEKFLSVKNFLGDGTDDLKLYQLSELIADLFDQYNTFRPEMMLKWEKGSLENEKDEDEIWQSLLWQSLALDRDGKPKSPSFADMKMRLKELLEKGEAGREKFPGRISLFGISYMPFEFLEILKMISAYTQVTIYQMNPCREYWGYIRKNRSVTREDAALHFEEGNSLLASLGGPAKDWINYLIDAADSDRDIDAEENMDEITRDSLLHCLQSDIYTLNDEKADKENIKIPDGSLIIQCCHSAMRETEVLKEQIIDMLQTDSTLAPEDILVMTPDIETFAPLIEAVFGTPEQVRLKLNGKKADEKLFIPYRISDRTIRKDSAAADLLLNILALRNERFRAGAVMNIIESPALAGALAFDEDEISLIRKWMDDTAVRWGYDAEEKKELGLLPEPQNTWQAALDRLFLAYSRDEKETFFYQARNDISEILSYDGVESSDGITLGKLAELLERLKNTIGSMAKAKTLAEWDSEIENIIAGFIAEDGSTAKQISFIKSAMRELKLIGENRIFSGTATVEVIEEYLSKALDAEGSQLAFMKGGITFCSTLPMRSIPFRVICMIGMDNELFPAKQYKPGFDLMSRQFRPGDRSRRYDDRYLFLETLMSAREKLYISYTGRSIKDDSEIPPSVVVSELLDYIADNYSECARPGEDIQKSLVTLHKLHPFSRAYFDGSSPQLFSYSSSGCAIAKSFTTERKEYEPFCPEPLPSPGQTEKLRITLDDLIRFFRNPSKYFITKRLGIYLGENEGEPEDTEAFGIDSLLKYNIMDEAARDIIENGSKDEGKLLCINKAKGLLPHGSFGKLVYCESYKEALKFAEAVKPKLQSKDAPLQFTIETDDVIMDCRIDSLYGGKIVEYRPASIKVKDRIRLMIKMAALDYEKRRPGGGPEENAGVMGTIYGTLPKEENYAFNENYSGLIISLIGYYVEGMNRPLPFFSDTSMEYAKVFKDTGNSDAGKSAAEKKWDGFQSAEKDDKYFGYCFGKSGPFAEGFEDLANKICIPILELKN